MATKREIKIMQQAIISLAKKYNREYGKVLKQVPDLVDEFIDNEKGWQIIQEIINANLEGLYEFKQLDDYDKFYNKAYLDQIFTNRLNYQLQYNFGQADQNAINATRSNQNWFVSKYYTLSDQRYMLNQMEKIWKEGISVDEATERVEKVVKDSNKRGQAYTKNMIQTNNARIRAKADLNNFAENDIKEYIFTAVIDDVTTDTCRELDGKIYSVEKALKFQKNIDDNVNKIIADGQRKSLPDWKIYNKSMEYLQNNDAFAYETGTEKRPWKSEIILRDKDPQKQGKKVTKLYKNLSSVPGNKIPRPPLHNNCRSRLDPKF